MLDDDDTAEDVWWHESIFRDKFEFREVGEKP
jgi:hypothetical protein